MAQQLARDMGDGLTVERALEMLEGQQCGMVTKWDSDRVAGTAVVFFDEYERNDNPSVRRVVVEMFAVENRLMRQGTELFVHLLANSARWNAQVIALKCSIRFINFWRRLGFTESNDDCLSEHEHMWGPRAAYDTVMQFRVAMPSREVA